MKGICFRAFLLLGVTAPAIAQYGAAAPDAPIISPKNGQTPQQTWADRYQCDRWATNQSGFDPAQRAADVTSNANASGRDAYRRAFAACLTGRGYSVRYGAPPSAPPPSQPAFVLPQTSPAPEVTYRPLTVHIDGGYSIAAGSTHQYVDDGPNVGLGLTWFPASALPIGLRLDGSYSRFDARRGLLDAGGYTDGYVNIYGGDADLQFDLAHRSSRYKLYLFGGAGWYREQTRLRTVQWEEGIICDFYFCAPGAFPVVTAEQRTTSPWHSSWNGGFGWEVALPQGGSFFIEARYLHIAPQASKMQFVPIRVGLRF